MRAGVVADEVMPFGAVFALPLEVLVSVLLGGAAGSPPDNCRRDRHHGLGDLDPGGSGSFGYWPASYATNPAHLLGAHSGTATG